MLSDNSLSYDSFESRRLFDGCNWQVAKKENGKTLSLPLCHLDPLGPSDDFLFPWKGKHGLQRMKSRASRAHALPWLSAFARTYKCLFLRPLNGTWGWSLEKLKRVAKQEITFHEVNPERHLHRPMNLGIDQISKFPFLLAIVSSCIDLHFQAWNFNNFQMKIIKRETEQYLNKIWFHAKINRINVYYIIGTRYTKLTFPVLTTQWHKNLYQFI